MLSCWKGSTCHPPDLRLGQTVTIEGAIWAVVDLNGGFASNSLVLKPHVERDSFRPPSPALRRKVATVVEPEFRRLLTRVRRQYRAALAAPDSFWLPPDEIRRHEAIAAATLITLQRFLRQLNLHRRDVPAVAALVPAMHAWIRQTGFELAAHERFQRITLGTPSTLQIEALLARQEVVT
ncbi:hypothetical protein [Synechococcus sp. CS-1328]|uniref:hypothetical protein n=1 Tax=Synechococcus sp. CS-1328 TaxID=2847976 RepID=UPI00223BA238|nr:hypothetical protein [Synechococcus sp. CS-1328]MCT0223864.1 hypothetical protein [Synechococcus sp. CS-1328]